jgi:molybdate transport system regulatory protein
MKSSQKKSLAELGIYLRFYVGEETALGPGKADLLAAIRDTGSLTEAGRMMGMSYRRAWTLVDTMNRCFTAPLVESTKGGKSGGGASKLTPLGETVLAQYRVMQQEVEAAAVVHFKKIQRCLAKP